MSLQQNEALIRSNDAPGMSSAFHSLFAPLVNGRHRYRIAQIRKATTREIRHLPASLQQDIAFADGTVIALS